MSASMSRGGRSRVGNWHWTLYVVLALAGALLTFAGARAQQKASDDAKFRTLIDDLCAAWSTGNAVAPAKFYAKDPGLVFYDMGPRSYHSWKEYQDGVQKELKENPEDFTLTAGKDLKVSRRGMIAWTTVSMHLTEGPRNGNTTETNLRYTGIWEKRGASWVLVHDHLSAPVPGN